MTRAARRPTRFSQPRGKDVRENGFSLPLAIIVGLILLLGGIGLANRVGLSVLGAVFQGQGLSARAAAEAGAERIIGELNMPVNRRFLLSSSSIVSNAVWSSTELATGSSLASACVQGSQTISSNRQLGTTGTPPSTGPYPWVYLTSAGQVTTDTNIATQAFRLVRIRRQPLSAFSLSSDGGWGTFQLVVDGASVRGGQLATQIRLDKEYQVMPKCCNLSFGSPHGRINYTFDGSGSSSDCLKDSLGFGLVGGAAENNTGTVVLRGNTEAFTTTNQPIPIVYCVVSDEVAGTCTPTDNAQNLSVRNVTANMPDIPLPPTSANATPGLAQAYSDGRQLLTTALPGGNALNLSSGSSSCPTRTTVTTADFCQETGTGPSRQIILNASATSLPSSCAVVPAGTISTNKKVASYDEVHCLVRRLNFDSPVRNLRIAVPPSAGQSSRKLILYFVAEDASSSDPVIKANGGGQLLACTTVSGTCTSPPNMTDVSFLGCPSPRQTFKIYDTSGSQLSCSLSPSSAITPRQTVSLGGTPSLGSGGGVFIWFPNGNIELVGTSAFTGVAWGNTVSANGTVDFVVPGSGLGNVLSYSGFVDPPTGTGVGGTFPIIDFIARATSNFKWCSVSSTASGC
jgi:hypothetical protein